MRITHRQAGHKDYWEKRWQALPVDEPMSNPDVYPLKYALLATADNPGPILEAGCGAGRILRYFQNQGREILGFDYIASVVAKLKAFDERLQVNVADVTCMPYAEGAFSSVLAFGLLHNLPMEACQQGMSEMQRVLKPGGRVCISFRADNLQNWLNDYWLGPLSSGKKHNAKNTSAEQAHSAFHKMNLTVDELKALVIEAGFDIEYFDAVQNMPLLYKFALFRTKMHRQFDESLARAEGYRLSWLGSILQNVLMRFPNAFCNLYVVVARKPRCVPYAA